MSHIDELGLARKVSDLLLLPIECQRLGRTDGVAVRLKGIENPNGFSVHITAGLQLVFAELVWDSFAQSMLQSISDASQEDWVRVGLLRAALSNTNVKTSLEIDGKELGRDAEIDSSNPIKTIEIRAQTLAWRQSKTDDAAEVAAAVLAILIALLPLDTQGESFIDIPVDAEVEGAKQVGISTRYERSRANRAVAILVHGTRCVVCEIDLGERYFDIGDNFVEIHHLRPVHLMLSPEVVNPITDLVPLCSNCHRMAHRTDPPHSPETLRASLRDSPREV